MDEILNIYEMTLCCHVTIWGRVVKQSYNDYKIRITLEKAGCGLKCTSLWIIYQANFSLVSDTDATNK